MSREREACSFRLNDVKRAVTAARKSGIEVGSVRFIPRRNGPSTIEIIAAKPQSTEQTEDLDSELKEFEARHGQG
jgi:hypothetical protein